MAVMALLSDPGYHWLIFSISAILAQGLWSCALDGEDSVLPSLLSSQLSAEQPPDRAWPCWGQVP